MTLESAAEDATATAASAMVNKPTRAVFLAALGPKA
jgi:hypothetical protein